MSASNTANPGRTDLPLISPNLRQLGAIDADKNRFLRSYIRSQEAYLAGYALEGQHVLARAGASTAGGVSHSTLRDVKLESGFGTPILKPRARISMRGRTKQAGDISRGDDGMHNPSAAQAERKRSDSAAPATEDGGRATSPKRRGTKLSRDLELPFPLELPHEAKEVREKDKVRGRASLKKGSTSKSREAEADEEHRQRLAERRERRRAKKAIVDPRPKATENSSDEEPDSERRDTSRKASKKKNKGLSVPAGLALMHGFSATNLGKKRLTVGDVTPMHLTISISHEDNAARSCRGGLQQG
ncbi:hypothetical protein BD413DRAFT_548710 [Trametes elegans]|nr:hypothetical protein BD413DRAFT_548710 [Trametes elegans]